MTRPVWVALYGMVQSFSDLHKPLHHDKAVIHEEDVSFRSLLNFFFFFFNFLNPCLHSVYLWLLFYFQDFESSLLSFLWILFQVKCLYFLNLFGLVSFCHDSSPAPCLSVLSFCLIHCVCTLLSAGCNASFPLTCGVCACVSLDLVWVLQWVELSLISLKGSISPSGVFWDCLLMGNSVFIFC